MSFENPVEQAQKCRRLARSICDERSRQALLELAEAFDAVAGSAGAAHENQGDAAQNKN